MNWIVFFILLVPGKVFVIYRGILSAFSIFYDSNIRGDVKLAEEVVAFEALRSQVFLALFNLFLRFSEDSEIKDFYEKTMFRVSKLRIRLGNKKSYKRANFTMRLIIGEVMLCQEKREKLVKD